MVQEGWPIYFDHVDGMFTWHQDYAPQVIIGDFKNYEKVIEKIKDYVPIFPAVKSNVIMKTGQKSKSEITWKIVVLLIVPAIWVYVLSRLIQQSLTGNLNVQGFGFEFLIILILGLLSVLIGGYGYYRNYQKRLDIVDQMDILYSYLKQKENKLEALKEIITIKNNKMYWKKYSLNWELESLFPTLSFIDLIALFGAIFSQVYIFISFINLTGHFIAPFDSSTENIPNLLINSVIIIFLAYYLVIGIFYGLRQSSYFELEGVEFNRFVNTHLTSMGVVIIIIFIIEMLSTNITAIFILPLIFGHIPIFAAFSTNRLLFLRNYIRIKTSILRQLNFIKMEFQYQAKEELFFHHVNEKINSLGRQSLLPTSHLRSYILVFTAFLTVLFPTISAILTSAGNLIDIIELLDPFS